MCNDTLLVRMPIHWKLLNMILFEVEHIYYQNPQPYLEVMFKTIFSLAYYGLMRIGELTDSPHVLKACNVHISQNKDKILLILFTSKTHDRSKHPQKIKISAIPLPKPSVQFFCPFMLIRAYLNLRGSYENNSEPFFIFADKTPVSVNCMFAMLKCAIMALHLDTSLYNFHGLRIGRSTDLYKMGYSIEQIKQAGHWKSNAVYKYIKN